MKYIVGYQLKTDDAFMKTIVQYRDHIKEVYFSWGEMPSGRNRAATTQALTQWEAQQKQIEDIRYLSQNGIAFNLLLNGNCYGSKSQSHELFQSVEEIIRYVSDTFGLQSVTTTSPLIARFIKDKFAGLEVRASVNMDIGTTQGMNYVAELFDSYYIQREYNRDKGTIEALKAWCSKNDKKLYLLANSGCLNHCSTHVFHDNLVAHENEIKAMDNAVSFEGQCWSYLKKQSHWLSVLRDTSFIRPEEISLYESWFDAVKLATRVHAKPEMVLENYIKGNHSGSVLDLCEPNHSGSLRPFLLENKRLPKDFNHVILTCSKNCDDCDYCREAFEAALVDLTKYQ